MRTTLNLDDDVAASLRDLSKREQRPLSRTVNDLLRSGLQARRARPPASDYEPPTFDTGRPLVDVTDIGAALEILDSGH